MKLNLAMVASVDGKITRGDEADIYRWVSKEDNALFRSLVRQHDVIIMGRKTYDAVRRRITGKPGILRLVMTATPQKYTQEAVPGILEFSSEQPRALLGGLAARGFNSCLLVSGQEVATAFVAAGLVEELYLTLEPRLFGQGQGMLAGGPEKNLKLLSVRQLNASGTLYLRYQVLNGDAGH